MQLGQLARDIPANEIATGAEHLPQLDVSGAQLGHGHANARGPRLVGEALAVAVGEEFLWQLEARGGEPVGEAILGQKAAHLAQAAGMAGQLFRKETHGESGPITLLPQLMTRLLQEDAHLTEEDARCLTSR